MVTAHRIAACTVFLLALACGAPAAAGEFTFAPELIRIDLGTPAWDLSGATVWDDKVGAGRWTARRAAPAVEAAAQDEAQPQPRFERIAFAGGQPARIGRAAAYGAEFDGRPTATGERFDMYRLTAASSELPLGAYADVVNQATGERVTVRINDRRPNGSGEVITLSFAAANRLGLDHAPDAPVKVEYLGRDAPARMTQIATR